MSRSPERVPELDRAIHEPARLAIVALLRAVESADFTFVRGQTDLTAGNLSAHVSKLEAAGYLEVEKSFNDRRPLTTLRLTEAGRVAFTTYAARMRHFLDRALGPAEPGAGRARRGRPAAEDPPR